jgi:hypothetical protein
MVHRDEMILNGMVQADSMFLFGWLNEMVQDNLISY